MTFQQIVGFVVDNGDFTLARSIRGNVDVSFIYSKNNTEIEVGAHYIPFIELDQCEIHITKNDVIGHWCTFYRSDYECDEFDYIDAVELTEFINDSGVLDD